MYLFFRYLEQNLFRVDLDFLLHKITKTFILLLYNKLR